MKVKRAVLISLTFIAFSTGGCRSAGQSVSRRFVQTSEGSLQKRSLRSAEKRAAGILQRDLNRDASSSVRRLPRDVTAFRYTTKAEAGRELRSGIRPGTHFTSSATRGRPLSAGTAQKRYGLPQTPQVRMTVRLPAGADVRRNKVIGGARGVGEITTVKRADRQIVRKVVPLDPK